MMRMKKFNANDTNMRIKTIIRKKRISIIRGIRIYSIIRIIMIIMKLNAKELRDVDEKIILEKLKHFKRNPIYFILENIYDTYNIGGLFRLADGLAIEKMYICGETEIPPNTRIKKASIGTYKVVPWVYKKTTKEAIEELKEQEKKIKIVAIEQDKTSIDFRKAEYTKPIAFVLGNETYGIVLETLGLVDQIVEIPMWGINKSLNVIVSAAIVSYFAMSK